MKLSNYREWLEINDLYMAHPDEETTYLWVDVETTGLAPHADDQVIEVAALLTDKDGNTTAEPYHALVYDTPTAAALARMPSVVREMHTKSGLIEELNKAMARSETMNHYALGQQLSEYVLGRLGTDQAKSICLAGSSVSFDREFLELIVPSLFEAIHYRLIDVSTVKQLCMAHNPQVYAGLDKLTQPKKLHRALPDIVDTIHEYKFYVENFLFIPGNAVLEDIND